MNYLGIAPPGWLAVPSLNAVRRAEVRDIGTPAGDPAQHVHLPRVRECV